MAIRGLGKIVSSHNDDENIVNHIFEKLSWLLINASDWSHRYAAIVSLEEISLSKTRYILESALNKETDIVVTTRIQLALAKIHQ